MDRSRAFSGSATTATLAALVETHSMSPLNRCCRADGGEVVTAGLEKSGAFVDHAAEIARIIPAGQILLLSDEYIHRYVIPGKVDAANPYGTSTYYGAKLIFKTPDGRMYVLTLPTEQLLSAPTAEDFPNLQAVLANVAKLKCDMYDNALLPVALVNKLVSLSDHPSSKILQKFALQSLGG